MTNEKNTGAILEAERDELYGGAPSKAEEKTEADEPKEEAESEKK